ncbi:hypothetical protein GGR44_000683 [Sphingobium fontiphilum]|uniref:Uncharacterized protein n=1 Tax=Sphingobium fontiphilum TaxID=944425 RepID=A0A7W6DE57_9SPHN|nr:hypothetical protein [Sphingobium fontiphilum]
MNAMRHACADCARLKGAAEGNEDDQGVTGRLVNGLKRISARRSQSPSLALTRANAIACSR